ncbi:Zn-dependent exopeptidase [Auriculariales sp. MPI-PUGE-AT-0066]|nr:Zn-dependent exopeptidase [Auriculariales sp. MPI-PUGE-AT-0066]
MDTVNTPDPSLSSVAVEKAVPQHLHSVHQKDSSVLSLAADQDHIFSGSQGQDIYVWDRHSYFAKTTLEGHTGPVLALEVSREQRWLFSSRQHCPHLVHDLAAALYTIIPDGGTDAGDIFSLAYSPTLSTLFFAPNDSRHTQTAFKRDKFFESGVRGSSTRTPMFYAQRIPKSPPVDLQIHNTEPTTIYVPAANTLQSAHYGYIYCMALLPSPHISASDPEREDGSIELLTGSGDADVRLWLCNRDGPVLRHTFSAGEGGGVLSLVARAGTVYAGCQAGFVKVWDLETRTLVRTIIAYENIDVLSLSMLGTDLYGCSANGMVQRWSASFDCTASWQAHDGIILSSIVASDKSSPNPTRHALVTGGNDNTIRYVSRSDTLLHALETFVSVPSAAIWLKKCLSQLGAEAGLLPTLDAGGAEACGSPLVLATFYGTGSKDRQRPRILFYGHYDVIGASKAGWATDPFTLTGSDGYLYGRGVTDNKGPILAAAVAASDMLARRALDVDVVMLIEGDEEVGSPRFADSVRRYKDQIGRVDAILVSNSYWIGENTPCITYGLRGVVHASVEISSKRADVHSGVDGGAVSEPMIEMIKLLSTLTNGQKVLLPGFYDDVRPMTSRELEQFELLANVTKEPAARLSSRWREPSLSVHGLQVSGPGNATVIPACVKATVSLRVVPDQDTDTIAQSLVDHLELNFRALQSPNTLNVQIERKADWWLGDLDEPWFRALEGAIKDEWGVTPLRIREGGSIPPIPILEKEFGCPALQLPLGQSSDQAHLANERISLINLRRGKSVIERFFTSVAHIGLQP